MQSHGVQFNRLTDLHQSVEYSQSELRRDIKLPSELSHVGNACRPDQAITHLNLLGRPKRKGSVGEVCWRQGLQHFAGLRPHHAQHTVSASHIRGKNVLVRTHAAFQPM